MATQKRKFRSDDFFHYTIEDDEVVEDEVSEEDETPPPKKAKKAKKNKKQKKQQQQPGKQVPESSDDEQANGSGDFDPDFEFFDGGNVFGVGDDEDEEEARHNLEWLGAERIVNLDELIRRRREKKEEEGGEEEEEEKEKEEEKKEIGSKASRKEKVESAKNGDEEEEKEDGQEAEGSDVDLDDDDDEVLADDGFGMGADSDEEASGDEAQPKANGYGSGSDEDEDAAASDNDSVATPNEHPDDRGSDDDDDNNENNNDDDDDMSSEEDEEEKARQNAFFGESHGASRSGAGKSALASVPSFQAMRLFSRPILRGISAAGFTRPTEIQAKTMPFAVEGKDVVGQAVTGSGKTAAFLLPIFERLLYRPTNVPTTRVVILMPTRELAVQCHKVAAKLAGHTSITMALTVGGTSFKASEAGLRARPDIVIGTPGRFIDHMRNSPSFAVDRVEILVLDEADRMLQDGFADELNEIVKTLPRARQTLLFSATMGASVDDLIRVGLSKPVRVLADGAAATTVGTLTQEFVRLRAGREGARLGYLLQLCTTRYRDHTIVFFREKRHIHNARIVFGLLGLTCDELHGNIKQAERTASLDAFRRGAVSFLLASDLAARGLDIPGVQTVINYEVPKNLEDYIHRVGRTARAGRRGVAVTLVAEQDRKFVRAAAKALRKGENSNGNNNNKTQHILKSRSVDPAAAAAWQAKVDALAADVAAIGEEERQARQLAMAEMEGTRGENLLKHRDAILARPERTWFETAREKEAKKTQARRATREERRATDGNGSKKTGSTVDRLRERLKGKRASGELSNKDRKRLDAKSERLAGMGGQKMRQEKKALAQPAKGKRGPGGANVAPLWRHRLLRLRSPRSAGFAKPSLPQPPRPTTTGLSHEPKQPPTGATRKNPAFDRRLPGLLPLFRRLLPPQLRASSLFGRLFGVPAAFRADRARDPFSPPPRLALRERYLRLRLEAFPRYRQRVHARLYRFVVDLALQQRRRRPLSRRPDLLPRASGHDARRLTPFSAPARVPPFRSSSSTDTMQYQDTAFRERGSRRRRLAAMAGTLYRAGAAAASEIREQYSNARSVQDGDSAGGSGEDDRPPSIPAAFPDVAIATGGDAQMVLFPMYAKRHVRKYKAAAPTDHPPSSADGAPATEGYWQREFARMEDEKAVVDVNIHGWLYLAPQNAPLTRRNRLLIGLARRLSGIPAPEQWVAATPAAAAPSADASNGNDEDTQEAHKIARAAAAIERRGQDEKEVANRGGYSETPHTAASYDDNSSDEDRGSSGGAPNTAKTKTTTTTTTTSGYNTPASRDSSPGQSTPEAKPKAPAPPPPGPGKLTPRSSWASSITGGSSGNGGSGALEMTEAELLAANANLLARLGPFLTAPVVQQPVTLFFYNEHQSQSRTVETSDAGHFSICALLDFVPTHVRVLVASSAPGYGYGGGAGGNSDPANAGQVGAVLTEPLSAVAPIHLVEDRGVSVISDIDDTVKTSNIALGTREIFRNTFVRDLGGLAVDGIRAWYTALHDLGVQFHYCSNSPWQLFPMLATFLRQVGLPQGPLHLKQYRGMLQGIFEPVAERKRGTLEKILRDFPDRRFLLVGDSGEADLEVYTDLVLAHPGRILAIFIRDVTTPEQPGYFDAASTTRPPRPQLPSSLSAVGVDIDNDSNNSNNSNGNHVADANQRRPALPPRTASAPTQPRDDAGPVMGTLIDLADDGPDCASDSVASSVTPTNSTATRDASSGGSNGPSSRRPLPPPRPSKPLALRGSIATQPSSSPLSLSRSPSAASSSSNPPPPPPAPRRKPVGSNAMTALTSIHPLAQVVNNSSNNSSGLSTASAGTPDDDPPPPPLPRRARTINLDESGSATPVQRQRLQQQQQQLLLQDQPQPQPQPPNKKVDMWRRRLAHAQAVLGPQGVRLYTWRRGQDVAVEAVGIVKAALGQDDRQGRPDRRNVDSKNNG
ncbi:ATP-dependent RNA helicase [Niveomyces insectorum RCEF 264]|uniref:ATP-dependent RNA helicase n=1 Tax=Niveomyces insectorum RCEF 264 TaxID=1081102 RepID=A0A162MBH5_9HYPO|nr:ATP-dependent RNA helicase [Niveomyces insectorum RCEF 264]